MIEGAKPDPFMLPTGPKGRSLMRELRIKIGTGDFSADEWAEIEAEALGMREAIKALVVEGG